MVICPYCNKVCKNESGLTQHQNGSKCRQARDKAAGCRTRAADNEPENSLRRSKRVRSKSDQAEDTEPSASPVSKDLVADSGHSSEDDGLVADGGDSEPDSDNTEGEDSGDSVADSDEPGEEFSEDEDEDEDDDESTTDSKLLPNREKLEEFRAYCDDYKGIDPLSKQKKKSIRLMDVLQRKKTPLNAYPELLEWHLRETGEIQPNETLQHTKDYTHRGPLLEELSKRYNLGTIKPKIKKVTLPSSKAVVSIPHRNAADCIVSLLTDPRIEEDDYLFWGGCPWAAPPEKVKKVSDLNTGRACLKTHKKVITKKNQVLVLVPMHMDGASIGQFCDLAVTPLKIGLGIHKRSTREKAHAWRTIGWIPSIRKPKSRGKKLFQESGHMEAEGMEQGDGDEGITDMMEEEEYGYDTDEEEDTDDKAQDFHTMVHTILKASGFLRLQRTNMIFDLVLGNKCYRNSELVFRVPMLKCDTEEGDINCGKYTYRGEKVKHGCRYCHCPIDDLDDPLARHKPKTQAQVSKMFEKGRVDKLKAISQQCINNAWYKVKFHEANDQGIHGACPSEMLHAILLGIFKCVRNIFYALLGDGALAEEIDGLAATYGKCLTHQSEKDFPPTHFNRGLNYGKMMGTRYRGVLLVMAAILRSSCGRKLLLSKTVFRNGGMGNWSHLVELLLQWEGFLCEKEMDIKLVNRLEQKNRYLMFQIQKVAFRTKGMGLKLMKYHAIIHLTNDILLFGVPKEVDTGPNESHHKPSKHAAKLTQRNEVTFLIQVAERLTEFTVVEYAMEEVENQQRVWEYFDNTVDVFVDTFVEESEDDVADPAEPVADLESRDENQDTVVATGGTRIQVFHNNQGEPDFKILGKSKSKEATRYNPQVVEFLCGLQNLVEGSTSEPEIQVYTEHKRDKNIWRAHPNYMGRGPWFDWVLVDWGADGILPAHIYCFVDLTSFKSVTGPIEYGGITLKSGVYAVVECADYLDDSVDKNRELIAESEFFTPITKEVEGFDVDSNGKRRPIRRFYLADCEAFHGVCSVIPDLAGEINAYFQVEPRREWVTIFKDWLKETHKADEIDMDLLQKIKAYHAEKKRLRKERKEKMAKLKEKAKELERQAAQIEE